MLDSDGNIVKTTDTSYKRQVISEDVSKRMTAILQKNATSESRLKTAMSPELPRGRQDRYDRKVALYYQNLAEATTAAYSTSFPTGGYAPTDDPQYALLVFYDEAAGQRRVRRTAGRPDLRPAIMEERCSYALA